MAVMKGNNSEDAKKDYYNSLVKDSFTDYSSDRMDFLPKSNESQGITDAVGWNVF